MKRSLLRLLNKLNIAEAKRQLFMAATSGGGGAGGSITITGSFTSAATIGCGGSGGAGGIGQIITVARDIPKA